MENKKKHKKLDKKAKIIIAIVLSVAVVGGGALYLFSPTKTASTVTYVTYTAKTGNIETTVEGSGSIASMQTIPYNALAAGVGTQITAASGDSVERGDLIAVLTSTATNSRMLSQVANAMTENYMSLTKLYTYSSGTTDVKSPVSGRVKLLNAKVGDDVAIDQNNGALCVISSDGDMYVEFTPAENAALTIGQTVKVEVGGKTITGKVIRTASQGKAKVLISTDVYDQGTDVKIYDSSGSQLGDGKLMINDPVPVVATGGYVSSISVKENSTVSAGSTLMKLVQTGLDTGYTGALAVVAPQNGYISGLAVAQGATLQSGATLFNLLSNDKFTLSVTVDELDIVNVKAGLSASVTVDALSDKTFKGTVLRASSVGTTASGVTSYTVIISLNNYDGIRPGMSATATIRTAFSQNVVIVPEAAIVSRGGKSYVMKASAADAAAATSKTFNADNYIEVQTGLSNGTYIEITGGLTAGTQISYKSSSSSSTGSTTTTRTNTGGFMDIGGGGVAPPANNSGTRPGGN